jgi:hypothetical protein
MCPGRASNSWSSSCIRRKSPLNTHKSLFVLLSFFICPCIVLSAFLQITAPEYHFGFFILCLIYNFISWKINKLGFYFKCVFKGDLRRMQLLDQELLALPGHMGSPPIFSGVHVTRSLVFWISRQATWTLLGSFNWEIYFLFYRYSELSAFNCTDLWQSV